MFRFRPLHDQRGEDHPREPSVVPVEGQGILPPRQGHRDGRGTPGATALETHQLKSHGVGDVATTVVPDTSTNWWIHETR